MFRLCPFPKSKVGRIMFFFLAVQLAGCIQYIVQVTSREFAIMVVFIVFGYIEIYRTLTFVCIAGIQNLFYQFDLFDDMSEACGSMLGGSTFSASMAL